MNAKRKIYPLKDKDVGLLKRLTKGGVATMKAHKTMESLFLMDDFRDFVQEIRKKEGLGEEGKDLPKTNHATFMEIYEFAIKYGQEINHYRENKKVFSFINKSIDLDQAFAINRIIASYILYGEVFTPENLGPGIMRIEQSPLPELNRVVFEFPVSTTKEEIISFIKKKYPMKKNQRTKPWEQFARDIFIYSHYLDIIEGKIPRKKGTYIEKQVAEQINPFYKMKPSNIADVKKRIIKKHKEANEGI